MRSSVGSCDNSKLNFDLKITCCYRQKPENKIKKKKVSGKSIVNEIVRSSSRIKQDENIKNFEVRGTPVSFEQCKNSAPYKTKIYSNFHSFCVKKDGNNTNKYDKSGIIKQKKTRDVNYQKHLEQERYYSSYREKASKKFVNRKPINPIVIPRIPLEIKTSLFPQSRTNFHNLKEPPLFSDTEEAQRAIMHVLNCGNDNFLQNRIRPLVSGNVLTRYIHDVYEYLYNRHVETLSNVATVELPPQRRSLHILNKDYLYEDGSEHRVETETVDTAKNESSEDGSILLSDEEDLAEDLEHVSINQPLVTVSPLPVT